jgi:excisionase family DNA binding protein
VIQIQETQMTDDDLANDMLDGIQQIADFLGAPMLRTYDWAQQGKIPVFKINRHWLARKSTLRRHIEQLEAETA